MVARIYMYRHAAVAFDNSERITATAFRTATNLYDTAPIAQFESPHPVPQCDFVIASSLRRSRETALSLFGAMDVSDDLFREAELPEMPLWPFRAKPTTFFAIARIFWLLGRSTDCETQPAFDTRVARAADILERAAQDHEVVGFIGHGFLNRYLLKALRIRGFSPQGRTTHEHGTYTLLTKP